jgi:F0F1-type ATP synthase membrane subunit b/b'
MIAESDYGGTEMQNCNFDLVHALESKLEAIQVYDQYLKDAQQEGAQDLTQIWQQLRQQDQQAVDQLRNVLVDRAKSGKFQ